MNTTSSNEFYLQLEGFRGLAILMVLVSHYIINGYFPQLIFLNFGFLGVNLFFVLSGFLITEILLKSIKSGKSKKKILKSFFLKRALRIFPIYLITIGLLAALNVSNSYELLPWTTSYTLNIKENFFDGGSMMFMHLWSLCVEEQFYMFWPFILLYISPKKHLYLFFFIILAALFFRMVIYWNNFENLLSINHSFPLACLDALALGGLLAYIKNEHPIIFQRIASSYIIPVVLLFIIWLLSSFLIHQSFIIQVLNRFIAGLIGFYLVAICTFENAHLFGKILENKFLRYLGKISYGIYLYHWILFFLFKQNFIDLWVSIDFGKFEILRYHQYLALFMAFTAVTLIISSISFYLIEKPLLQLKKYIS